MDYTQDMRLIKLLRELSEEVTGLDYTLESDRWKNDQVVIASRRKTTNQSIKNVLIYLNSKDNSFWADTFLKKE